MASVTEEFVEVRIAAATAQEADTIAHALVHERLAACVQVIPGVHSTYLWQGVVETATEVLLTAKTVAARFEAIAARVRELHSYDVPEIIAIPVDHLDASYAEWLTGAVRAEAVAPESHEETERKFTLPGGRPAPDAADWPGVDEVSQPRHHHLRAMYYDTPDVRLARRGVTLRRRTGGTDEGWHLKVPRDADSRVEQWLPLAASVDGQSVPVAFQQQLAEVLAEQTLGAICEVETRRAERDVLGHGVVLAAVCEDYVWTHNLLDPSLDLAWRELEVELSHGGLDFLDRVTSYLREHGVRQASIASKLRTALGPLLDAATVGQGAS